MGANLYDTDFCAWAQRQADLIRAGRLEEVDFEHVAEEIESPLWKLGMELGRFFQPVQTLLHRTPLDPVKPWTQSRELPPLAQESFKDWWRNRK